MQRSQLLCLMTLLTAPAQMILAFTVPYSKQLSETLNCVYKTAETHIKKTDTKDWLLVGAAGLTAVSLYGWVKNSRTFNDRQWSIYSKIMQEYMEEVELVEKGITPETSKMLGDYLKHKLLINFPKKFDSYSKQLLCDIATLEKVQNQLSGNKNTQLLGKKIASSLPLLREIKLKLGRLHEQFYEKELNLIKSYNVTTFKDAIDAIIVSKSSEDNLYPYTTYINALDAARDQIAELYWPLTYFDTYYPNHHSWKYGYCYDRYAGYHSDTMIDPKTGKSVYTIKGRWFEVYNRTPIARTWVDEYHKNLYQDLQKLRDAIVTLASYKSEMRDIKRNR